MLTIFLRTVLIFFVLLVVIRLMGKRQIGEMEPFELAITLVIAELACIPMADKSIPLSFGIISIFSMLVVHRIIILITKKSIKAQNIVSGKVTLVIDKNGIKEQALESLNMHIVDLMQALRSAGYFSLKDVAYAVFETNGTLSVLAYGQHGCTTMPVSVIMGGQWSSGDIEEYGMDKDKLEQFLHSQGLAVEDVLLLTIDEKLDIFCQPKGGRYFLSNLETGGDA